MISSILQLVLVYVMSTLKVLRDVCSKLNKLCRRFWWRIVNDKNRYYCLMVWDPLCQPKWQGGLGFKLFKHINKVLLVKLAWKLLIKENAYWVQNFQAKYHKGQRSLNVKPCLRSWAWRGIQECKQIVKKGCCLIGSRPSIRATLDLWALEATNFILKIKDSILPNYVLKVLDLSKTNHY